MEQIDKAIEANLYWTLVSEARIEARTVSSGGCFPQTAIDDLGAIALCTDWPRLRLRAQKDLAEAEVKLDTKPAAFVELGP